MANYSSYINQLDKLYHLNIAKGIKLGLDRMRALHTALGAPSSHYNIVHVAGTNGKGSVCHKIAEALRHAGHRVGLFTSPHISCYRERIRIDGEMIAEEEVEEGLAEIFRYGGDPTFFEVTTLLSMLHFRKRAVDWAVLETGLGGRCDATNIVTPNLSIITTIGYDHCQYLGDTLEAITFEKAGIAKNGVPLLIGPKVPREYIARKEALYTVDGSFTDYEEENRAIAKEALRLLAIPSESAIDRSPPCRFEKIIHRGKLFILDVAHNPQGLHHLFQRLGEREPFVIAALSRGKDLDSCLRKLSEASSRLHLVTSNHNRLAKGEELLPHLPQGSTAWQGTIGEAIEKAVAEKGSVVICGSFFIMEEARRLLGIEEPCDPRDMNER